jgi:hypothetical protein
MTKKYSVTFTAEEREDLVALSGKAREQSES